MQGNRRATPKDKHLVENINGFSLEEIVSFLFKHNLVKESYYLLWIYALLLRWTVGLHSYSGAKTPPMYGDYEAQRHWMEITINLPMSDWYFDTPQNNLLYWGLDYPPLTAYVSYFFGIFAAKVEPEMVALTSSHGYETSTSKVIMRLTVLFSDILLFIPALFWLTNTNFDKSEWTRKTVLKLILLSQPAFLLIDHGHFQYNCVFLGLTTLAAVLIINDHDFFGSVCFSLALNFKQMALYYAPAIGMYLFAKCIYQKSFITHLTMLGIAVVSTFALMWYPFCFYAPQGQTCFSSIAQGI
jgi:alpha-1,3-glucosyltransferase